MELQTYNQLWTLLKLGSPRLSALFLAASLSLLGAAAMLVYPLIAQELIGSMSNDQGGSGYVILIAGTVMIGIVAIGAANLLLAKIGHDVSAKLRSAVLDRLLRLPMSTADSLKTGESLSRIMSDGDSLSSLVTSQSVGFVNGALMLAGSIAILFWLDMPLTLVLLGSLMVSSMAIGPAIWKMERLARDQQEQSAGLSGLLVNVLSELRLVKAFVAEERELERCRTRIWALRDSSNDMAYLRVLLESGVTFAVVLALLVILIYGGVRVGSGQLSSGTLTAFVLYIYNVVGPFGQIAGFLSGIQSAKGASTRLSTILNHNIEHSAGDIRADKGLSITFDKIDFAYPGTSPILIKEMSLTILPNTTTALVGLSGSGKSTILALLQRLYQPCQGTITYGGRPINEYSLASWRSLLGVVAQDCPVMPGTIRENVAYGVTGYCTDRDIWAALAAAKLADFVSLLPNGIDTVVAERGINLSGGQKQRLSIARVFIRDPSILLLDEATSSLDSRTEQEIYDSLRNLMAHRTNVVVAHRLSTVINADQIAFIDKGMICGVGTHQELMDNLPEYRELANKQLLRT